jgi:putative alpha-1,2-mannosidase
MKNLFRSCITFSNILLLSAYAFVPAQAQEKNDNGAGNLKYIDPRIGNVGQLLQPTRPTVQLPNQMIRMFPQRTDYMDDQIASFPLNIVSHRLGEVFSIKPSVKKIEPASWNIHSAYDYDLEVTRPWYYSTFLLDEEVNVEFVPGKKTGYYRFEFPSASPKSILFATYNPGESAYKFISTTELTGMETYHDNVKVYLYGVFDSGASLGVIKGDQVSTERLIEGKGVKAWINFDQSKAKNISFKYAISHQLRQW